jgi:hypothetical protein
MIHKPEILKQVLKEVESGVARQVLSGAGAETKSTQNLMSSLRAEHGGKATLKKTSTVVKQSLLTEVRSASLGDLLKETKNAKSESVRSLLTEVRANHGSKESLKKTTTVDKRAMMVELRAGSHNDLSTTSD